MRSNVLTSSLLAATASAAIVQIQVSQSGSNTVVYSPDSVTANVGDTVIFNFQNSGHDVAQSAGVDSACQPSSGGFYSGFQSTGQGFAINITNTDPIWYYCSAPNHCRRGMAGVINPAGASISDYKSKAASASSSAPSVVGGTGGQLGSVSDLQAAASNSNNNAAAAAASSSPQSSAAELSSSVTAAASSAASSASVAASSVAASVSSLVSSVTAAASSSIAAGASAASTSSTRSSAGVAATGVPVAMAALAGLAALL